MSTKKYVKIGSNIEVSIWGRFIQKVVAKHGKTSGGVIRESLEEALELWLKQK